MVLLLCIYAPNFKEVGGAYCFWVVRPSSVRFLYGFMKKLLTRNFFLTGLSPFSELWPFEKIWMQSCQQNISKTIEAEARALKLDE